MKVTPTELPGVLLLEPRVLRDERGFFLESYNARVLAEAAGIRAHFVQDNHSRSRRNTLRGLHYQVRQPQGKLVRVLAGEIWDVGLDIRRDSPAFGRWEGVHLGADDFRQLWLPPGLAHGFLVLSEWAEVLYKTTEYYAPEWERCIRWDDPELGIEWPLAGAPLLSPRDAAAPPLHEADLGPAGD